MATEKRLIDANALKIHRMHNAGANHPLDVAYRKDIDNASTVDAVEVVHGEWRTKILCGGFAEEWGYVCSVCGCTVSDRSKLRFGKFATGNQKLNYCPNCGAKMDGDGNG